MLDIQFIRDNAAIVKEASKNKNVDVDIDKLLGLDEQRRDLQAKVDNLRQQRNEIAAAAKNGRPSSEQINKGKKLKCELAELESDLRDREAEAQDLLKKVPNLPAFDVPVGSSEDDNQVVKTVGDKPEFDFEAKNHWELAQIHGWIDKERAAKVAGARFAYVKGDLVLLQLALMQYAVGIVGDEEVLKSIIAGNDLMVSSNPFVPVLPPAMIRTEIYEATARLDGEETTYKLADDELWLNASAEHSMCPMYQGEVLDEADLPIRYVGYTTAFRREAGSYGKDMEGIFRQHQFDKLEMESFSTAEDSLQEHHFLVAIQEYLMQQLELPYQVILKCTADIGNPNARGVDIDTWLPGQQRYRETHTADLITDYQARRLQTRVRRENGELELVHTNDATAIAGRTLIAILENYQTKDGKVRVPEVLQPYLGKEIIS